MSARVMAPAARRPRALVRAAPLVTLASVVVVVVVATGCLDPMPLFGGPCGSDEDCAALGVCFEGACVPKDFPGLGDGDDDAGAQPDAGGEQDAGGDDGGPVDAGQDAGPVDAGFDAGPEDAGERDAGDDDDAGPGDAGPGDAGFDAGPPAECGDGVVEGDEECDWGEGRNGIPTVLCSSSCTYDLSVPRRINLDPLGGEQSGVVSGYPIISANGRFVVYQTDALDVLNAATEGRDARPNLALLDLATGTTVLIDAGANDATASLFSISADGEVVVFASRATNLTPDPDTNNVHDVFAYRRSTGTITLVSKNPDTGAAANAGSLHPYVDASGNTVVFMSEATDLVPATPSRFEIFKVNLDAPTQFVHVSTSETGGQLNEHSENPLISGDGSTIAFYMYASNFDGADTNDSPDSVFVAGETRGYISRLEGQGSANGASYVQSVSHDGRLFAFRTTAESLSGGTYQQSMLFDRATNQMHRIAWSANQPPNATATGAIVSGDGRYVAFASGATNLVTGDTSDFDIFVRRVEGFTPNSVPTRVTSYNAGVGGPSMPYDGSVILFSSHATNVVPNDTNGYHDLFLVANPLYP